MINTMDANQNIVSVIIKNLENSFVEDFDKMDGVKDLINSYLKDINFNYEYDYNTFCIELKNTLSESLYMVDKDIISFMDLTAFINESVKRMIGKKILEIETEYVTNDVNLLSLINELKNNIENKQK